MRPFLTLHDPSLAREYYARGLWTTDTFYGLLQSHANHTPSSPALRDGNNSLSWLELMFRVDALAGDLSENGIGAGDRVSIWMSNKVDAMIAFLACSRIGAACNPSLHRSYTCAEIIDLLTTLQTSVLVTEDGWGADRDQVGFEQLAANLPSLKKIYRSGHLPEHAKDLKSPTHTNPDSVAYLAFTSGSTGSPKCVMHSSNTLLSNARDLVQDWKIGPSDVILTLSPLSHHIAWVAAGQWLVSGAQLVLNDPGKGLSQLDWIIETGATYVLGVPTHAIDVLSEQKQRKINRLGSTRVFYLAGAPIPDVVAKAFTEQGIKPQNVYGMTECSSHQYTHPDDPIEIAVATCGRGGNAYEVKIWDPENQDVELKIGETGEIGGRGPALMLGYYANQQANEKSFNRHGYLMSGDLGALDAHGNLQILGRSKDLIIRGGHNIYPSRIEALALKHAKIEKAAAFAVADPRLGEKVCLAIIGEASAEDTLKHLAHEGLSKFDMPEWFISLHVLPLTASGKILKRELVDMVKRGEIAPQPIRYEMRSANS